MSAETVIKGMAGRTDSECPLQRSEKLTNEQNTYEVAKNLEEIVLEMIGVTYDIRIRKLAEHRFKFYGHAHVRGYANRIVIFFT